MNLTTVPKALEIVVNNTVNYTTEIVNLTNANGRVLKEVIVADRDFPPFNRVSMDGVAINTKFFNSSQKEFIIEGVQPAGKQQLTLKTPNACLEVMTGAVLPKNTNAVIPYEQVLIKNGLATLQVEEVVPFKNVHKQGLDQKKGAVLIKKNITITAAEIGILATVGKAKVKVARQPSVAVISTGNELISVAETPKTHQIRRSNVHTIISLLQNLQIKANPFHIVDDKDVLKTKISELLENYDVLIFSGAVSRGKYDFIPEVLDDLKVEKLFHKVAQRPGKPFWFGKKKHKVVFAFPGNPVSTFVSFLKYFIPWYQKTVSGKIARLPTAKLTSDFYFKPNFTYFLQVKLESKEGVLYATPIKGEGSGDLANLLQADAFIELPKDKTHFEKGEIFSVLKYR